jgi:hypothetical protein
MSGEQSSEMAVDVDIDVGVVKDEIKKTYSSVSTEPDKDFIFPTGRSWAQDPRGFQSGCRR